MEPTQLSDMLGVVEDTLVNHENRLRDLEHLRAEIAQVNRTSAHTLRVKLLGITIWEEHHGRH